MAKILEIKDVSTAFAIDGQFYNAVDNVSIDLYENEILAIVGESGCGKSTLATTIMGLHDPVHTESTGQIMFDNSNLLQLSISEFDNIRGKEIGMIFQDPLSALNPLMRIEEQIAETLKYHTSLNKEQIHARVIELLSQVGILNPKRVARQFPHELSGGMRQRVMIALAIACKPKLIIADEPTTALDVTIQAQILSLLKDIQNETKSGIILITHDLGVVAEMADRVAVMYGGQIVEIAPVQELFKNPKHPYTRMLLDAIPQVGAEHLSVIEGVVPSLKKMMRSGCRFAPRIDWISKEAHESDPQLHQIGENHFVRCSCYKTFKFKDEEGI